MTTNAKINGKRVTPSQAEVYAVLELYGPLPDHALVPLAQHVVQTHQSSSGIRSRRAELVDLGLVRETDRRVKMPSGRNARTFEVA